MSRASDNKPIRPSVHSAAHSTTQGTTHSAPSGSAQASAHATASASDEAPLITRRRLLYGAAGVGALAAVGIGAAAINAANGSGNSDISYLNAPDSALSTLTDFTALDSSDGMVTEIARFDLPYGSLVWVNDESVAACLLPTEKGSPLAQVGLLFLGSGEVQTVLEQAVGASEGFEIYDVRANSTGLIWTEANILQGTWRVYSASLSEAVAQVAQSAILLEEGDETYETPTLAVAANRGFWQVLPRETGAGRPSSRLMGAEFGSSQATCAYEADRRMATPPYGCSDSITISPRVDSPTTYYQLTNIHATTGEVVDTLTLPHAMIPLEAGYGKTGFMFSFPDIYNYGGAISNLGTYTPLFRPDDLDYNSARWFGFARTPSAPPAWCNNLLIVKSTYSICGVDLAAGTYFAIDVENGADSYGEYLASTGVRDIFVTYTNIDHTPVGQERIHACRVKVWTTNG